MSKIRVDVLETRDGTKTVNVADLVSAGGVATVNGRTGAVTLSKSDVGLASVDNTSDADKPVSTAVAAALGAKLPATNPQVTGTIVEDVFAITDGASVVLDPSNGSIQTWALGASRSPTTANFASGQSIVLMITAGANTITWPSVTWTKVGGGGVAPTLTTTGQNVVVLWKVGSTLFGSFLGTA